MNEGIPFEEACKLTPEGLTSQQLQNCPGQESTIPVYIYIGVPAAVLALVVILFVIIKSKRSRKSS